MSTGSSYCRRDIVESFLQNVVVVDDLAFMHPVSNSPEDGASGQPIVSPDYPGLPAASENTASSGRSDVSLNADTVINGFADIGMVCAVLNADPDSGFPERTAKVAARADIVVLDWKIHDSAGDDALRVMSDILADDRNSHRLRLIAIYTGEPNLRVVSERVKAEIREFYAGEEVEVSDPSRITKGPVCVVILAKEGTISSHGPSGSYQEVPEDELANWLVNEFVLMTSGLLRGVALAGIATIRQNAHRLLARFDEDLDPAYLGHRLLLPHPPDAEDHLVAALGSELLSVLEEDRPGTYADIEAIERWLKEIEGLELSQPFRITEEGTAVDCWRELLLRGIDASDSPLSNSQKKNLIRNGTASFTDGDDSATRSNRQFAALLSLRTRYPGQVPRLALGTILHTIGDDDEQYVLCLQPKCDSVRLDAPSGFPLMPLETVRPDGNKVSFHVAVELDVDNWREFGVNPKPSELIVRSFAPTTTCRGEVLATEEEPGHFYFEDIGERRYRWIAEMKEEHAFRVAGAVASALARPGPNDAEWLRRASR